MYVLYRSRYTTFAALAGVDPTDHTAATAGLPKIDGFNFWPRLSGATTAPAPSSISIPDAAPGISMGHHPSGIAAKDDDHGDGERVPAPRATLWAGPNVFLAGDYKLLVPPALPNTQNVFFFLFFLQKHLELTGIYHIFRYYF